MAIIFNAEDLKDVKPPCVIQSFINHNAVLYKVFVVGESYTVVERPSLKNFPSGPSGNPSAHTSALYKCFSMKGHSCDRVCFTAVEPFSLFRHDLRYNIPAV